MTLFKALALAAIFIVAFIAAFIIARELVVEQARGGQDKIGSVSSMPAMPVLRGAVD